VPPQTWPAGQGCWTTVLVPGDAVQEPSLPFDPPAGQGWQDPSLHSLRRGSGAIGFSWTGLGAGSLHGPSSQTLRRRSGSTALDTRSLVAVAFTAEAELILRSTPRGWMSEVVCLTSVAAGSAVGREASELAFEIGAGESLEECC
jgi:hypothetical protein